MRASADTAQPAQAVALPVNKARLNNAAEILRIRSTVS